MPRAFYYLTANNVDKKKHDGYKLVRQNDSQYLPVTKAILGSKVTNSSSLEG